VLMAPPDEDLSIDTRIFPRDQNAMRLLSGLMLQGQLRDARCVVDVGVRLEIERQQRNLSVAAD